MTIKAGKACAVAGAALVATAASLYSAGLGMQHIAMATANVNATSSATCEIAKLGVFKSSYMPECAGLPGTAMTIDTLEFWPLFPAQNRFGQISQVAVFGVGSTPFTNCDDYISLTAAQLQAGGVAQISKGLSDMVLEAFGALNAQLGAVQMVLGLLVHDGMSMADWDKIKAQGVMADSLLPGTGKFFQLLAQVCQPPLTQTLAFCADLVQDALSAPIDTKTNKTFQSPIPSDMPVWIAMPVFDSYFNLTNTVVQILTSPQMAAFESMGLTVPAKILQELVAASDLVYGCSAAGATNALECAVLAEVPNNGFSGIYPLAPMFSATHSIGSFYDFATGYVLSQALPQDDKLQAVYVSLIAAANCALNGNSNATYCTGVEAAAEGLGGFYPEAIAPPPITLGNGNTQARMSAVVHNITQQCLLNDKDLAIFTQARAEMYAVLTFVWFAVIAGFALALYIVRTKGNDRLALFALPALATIIASVLCVVALLGLHSAPIYALVGKPCVAGQLCYTAGNSIPIAIGALLFSSFAIIAFTTLIALPAWKKSYAWRTHPPTQETVTIYERAGPKSPTGPESPA
jgi:hypothetical protein